MILRISVTQDNSVPNPLEEENSWVNFWVKETIKLKGFGVKPKQNSTFCVQFLHRLNGQLALSEYNVGQGFAYSEIPIDSGNLDTFQEIVVQAITAYNQWVEGDVWAVTIDTDKNTDTSYECYGLDFQSMALDFNWVVYGINTVLGEQLLKLAHENEGEILAFTEGESYPSILTGTTKVFRLVEGSWEAYN